MCDSFGKFFNCYYFWIETIRNMDCWFRFWNKQLRFEINRIESRDKFDVALIRLHFNGLNLNRTWLWQLDDSSYSFSDTAIFEKYSQKLFDNSATSIVSWKRGSSGFHWILDFFRPKHFTWQHFFSFNYLYRLNFWISRKFYPWKIPSKN